jgi:hypothetical protein
VLKHLGEKRHQAKVVESDPLQSTHIAIDTFHHPCQQCAERGIVGDESSFSHA